jgi:Flp pilus assembly protein TadG
MEHIPTPRPPPRLEGNVAIEFGLILPTLLIFTLGIMDAGRLFWTNITLTRATEAAARCAAVNNAALCANVSNYVKDQAWGIAPGDITVTVNAAATCGGAQPGVQVSTSYIFQFVTPWFYPLEPFGDANRMTLNATACFPKQS